MTQINAKIVADSKNEFGNRITTMVVTFPRIILAEFNTHRMFSRNSASSRAIPFEKMVKSVEENPFIPIAWQKDHKGMQGSEYFTFKPDIIDCEHGWLGARDFAVQQAKALNKLGVTKQLCNRLLEPFMYHQVIVTATEWENFFKLRCPQYCYLSDDGVTPIWFRSRKDFMNYDSKQSEEKKICLEFDELGWRTINKSQAEIHIQAIAELMWDAYNESIPKLLQAGEWHIPFGDDITIEGKMQLKPENIGLDNGIELDVKIATARCARVSYTVVGEEGKEPNYENDIKLHDRLLESGHMSPFEHIGQAMNEEQINSESFNSDDEDDGSWGWSGNFRGFIQYRKMLPGENRV